MKSLKKIMLMGLLAVMLIPTISGAASFSGNTYTNVFSVLSSPTTKNGSMTVFQVRATQKDWRPTMTFRAVDQYGIVAASGTVDYKDYQYEFKSSAVRGRNYTVEARREGTGDSYVEGYWGI
ncbi:hypothetical protein [Miniphocaeibacter massiliensis]|uniref:hypothetical protein n=1 Tax=Miniphocaeibacter massiliensis TaxID=2041841 RepID=UPI000C1C3032|nr:hypothetical protein [Miniphocaeibacter massiliensis]